MKLSIMEALVANLLKLESSWPTRIFVSDMGVVDLQYLGGKYTWFQPNGPAASRIDRIMISQELVDLWKVRAQWIGDRDASDHCPMWLVSSNKNWGPKPFKFINGWLKHKDSKAFIEEKWKEHEVEGWMAQIVKEKLKYVKEKLKVWNKEVYGIMDLNMENIVREMNVLEEEVESEEVGRREMEGAKCGIFGVFTSQGRFISTKGKSQLDKARGQKRQVFS